MKLLLKDCVRYVPYEYQSEAELESMVFEHYREIFGENALIFPKKRIESLANKRTIPDGFVIEFKSRKWFVIEIELSKHSLYDHVIPQISRFNTALKNPTSRKSLAKAFYNYINADPYKIALLKANGIEREMFLEILKIIETTPQIVVIIDKITPDAVEATGALKLPTHLLEFRTFVREGSTNISDHIHVFDSLVHSSKSFLEKEQKLQETEIQKGQGFLVKLIETGIVCPGFKVYRKYKGTLYEAEITERGTIRILNTGNEYTSLSSASDAITGTSTNGWQWWKYRDETGEHSMDELRKKLTSSK